MRAPQTIRQSVEQSLEVIHRARRNALWRAVDAAVVGRKLWLSALGRNLSPDGFDKHGIKAVDRLLGNEALHREIPVVYGAIAKVLLQTCRQVVLLIDETEIRPGVCALTASVAFDGRGFPIYGIVRSKRYTRSQKGRAGFLRGVAVVLPPNVRPILVTDADFESPWFATVKKHGWDFVGRVRNRTKFFFQGEWVGCQHLHALAGSRAKKLGQVCFPRREPTPKRLILSARPRLLGRKRINSLGRPGRTHNDRVCSRRQKEPWLLATSLTANSSAVVEIYAKRMQIEENYRDCKSHRWGLSLRETRSRSHQRIEVLLLLAALTIAIAITVGVAAERADLARRFQANTIRDRRSLSLFALGLRVLVTFGAPPQPQLLAALAAIHQRIQRIADVAS